MEENQELFEEFATVHQKYEDNRTQWQDEYNKQGQMVVEVIREWESRLCQHSEKGEYAKFSSKLSEKFWEEVKAFFPLIDFVGVEITKKPGFVVKGQVPEVVETEDEETDADLLEIDKFEVLGDEDEFVITRLR